jgi:cob(I)alamin adenosyltransferase
MAIKIYTKTGDSGLTSLLGGTKVPKSHLRIESYGTVDELNSHIGFANDLINHEKTNFMLREIQDRLFTIGASLAVDPEKEPQMKMPDLSEADIFLLEAQIDTMETELPPMKSFIIPGGHMTVSALHICRCVCRRAERICVFLQEEAVFIDPLVIKYMNRLSDYLFVLSRYMSHVLQAPEIPWKPRVKQ